MGYAPLDFCRNIQNEGEPFPVIRDMMKQEGVPDYENLTEDDFIRYALRDDFCSPEYHGPFERLDQALYSKPKYLQFVVQYAGGNLEDFEKGKYSIATEWRDFFLSPCLWWRWAKNKQVYKPDKNFAEALIGTEKLSLTKHQIEHLPCKSIYIDMEDCGTEPAIGAFVFVVDDGNSVSLATYLLTADLLFFSFYASGDYDENGMLQIDIGNLRGQKEFEVFPNHAERAGISTGKGQKSLKLSGKYDRIWITKFALQLLCYLSSKEPDVVENPQTKKTYKPSATVKNKFSEVQQWDVGVRYGKAVRARIAEETKKYAAEGPGDGGEEEKEPVERKSRKSPVPHFRSAHWQRFWVGEGRRICEIKWIEPIFVGLSESKDVVIHRMY